MRVLELGVGIPPAYAGMVLAEQGHEVTRWLGERPDPVRLLRHGEALWAWLMAGKRAYRRHAESVRQLEPGDVDVVVDDFHPSSWREWGVDPALEAKRLGAVWVSLRAEDGGPLLDPVAQARAWGDHVGFLPIRIADTAAGLWLAFKALAANPGHHVLWHAGCLAKLVEGELVVPMDRSSLATAPCDEPGETGREGRGVVATQRGVRVTEPFRTRLWRLENLTHRDGRIVI